MGKGPQSAAEVEKAVQARFPHYRLDHASYEKKGLPATWHCALHELDFRANASTLLSSGSVGCPAYPRDWLVSLMCFL